jgi:hypothetical protein
MIKNLCAGFAVAGFIVVAILLANHDGWPHSPESTHVRLAIVLGVISLLVVFIFWCPAVRSPGKTTLGEPKNHPASAETIANEYVAMLKNYERETINLFLDMLFDPPHYLNRIIETATIEPNAPTLRLSTRQVSRMRHSHGPHKSKNGTTRLPKTLLVPLVWPERGALLDNFEVSDASGNAIPTLSYNQVRGLLAYALEYSFTHLDSCYRKKRTHLRRSHKKAADKYQKETGSLLRDLVITLCSPGPLHKPDSADRKRFEKVLSRIANLPSNGIPREKFSDFCRQYFNRYLIVAEVSYPSTDNVGLTYTHCVSIESPTNYPFNVWREKLGLNPSAIDVVHNPFAFEVEAYHLEITAQTDQYVWDHHLEWLDTNTHVRQDHPEVETAGVYVQVYQDGRPNAHLYVRRQSSPEKALPSSSTERSLNRTKSVIHFREIPPGALLGVTIVAVVSAVVIAFIGLSRLGFGTKAATAAAPFPALLLAVPGFLSVLIGPWSDPSRLRRTSLTTYLALLGTMIYSLGGALFYLFGSGRPLDTLFTLSPIFLDKWHVGRSPISINTDVIWLILIVVTTTHAVFLCRQFVSELRYYHRCIRGRFNDRV